MLKLEHMPFFVVTTVIGSDLAVFPQKLARGFKLGSLSFTEGIFIVVVVFNSRSQQYDRTIDLLSI